jgi:hypothetical protein
MSGDYMYPTLIKPGYSMPGEDDFDEPFLSRIARMQTDKAVAEREHTAPSVEQIPYEGIEAIGEIFLEGESKYGIDNWKKAVGDEYYRRIRTRHAIRHLMLWANGDRSENHLAKVAWFCVTQIWISKRENELSAATNK